MSLQTYRPQDRGNVKYTYESLAQCVEDLTKQIQRTKAAADWFEREDDYRKYIRLARTQQDNKTKLDNFTRAFSELRKAEPNNPLDEQIASQLDQARRTVDELERQVVPIGKRQEELEEQRKTAAEEQARLDAIQAQKSKEQEEAEQMAADLDFLARETADIANTMTIVNETTHEVDDLITDQHETLVHVDEVIEEAKDEMVAGNKELGEAEDDQKGGSKIMWIILASSHQLSSSSGPFSASNSAA
jgi:chromosome segregation ATPase